MLLARIWPTPTDTTATYKQGLYSPAEAKRVSPYALFCFLWALITGLPWAGRGGGILRDHPEASATPFSDANDLQCASGLPACRGTEEEHQSSLCHCSCPRPPATMGTRGLRAHAACPHGGPGPTAQPPHPHPLFFSSQGERPPKVTVMGMTACEVSAGKWTPRGRRTCTHSTTSIKVPMGEAYRRCRRHMGGMGKAWGRHGARLGG